MQNKRWLARRCQIKHADLALTIMMKIGDVFTNVCAYSPYPI